MTESRTNSAGSLIAMCISAALVTSAAAQSTEQTGLVQRLAKLEDIVEALERDTKQTKRDAVTVQSGTLVIRADGTRSLTDSSRCIGDSDNTRGIRNERIKFPTAYIATPDVVVALSSIDIAGGGPTDFNRLRIIVESADPTGFHYQFYTSCWTRVDEGRAVWVAHGRTSR